MKTVSISLRRISIAALLFSVTACAWFGEDSQRAEMMAMPAIDKTMESARTELTASEYWPQQDWWTQFADPVLNRLITNAIANSPSIKTVEARLRQSQAMADAHAAELYPTVDTNISFSAERFSANSVQAKLAGEHFRKLLINPLVLRYHLDFWGHDQAALQAAVGRSLAMAAELADARLLLAVEVAGSYFDLQAATERQSLADAIVADREALAKLMQIRFDTGLSGEQPTLQAQIALNNAKQLQARFHAETELQRNRLAALSAQGPDWGRSIEVQTNQVIAPLPLPKDLPLHLLSRRPDLSAARLRAEAAAEDIKVAETAFYPDVNLFAFTGLHSVSLTDIALQGSSLAYAVGPSINFPIFQGGRLRANLGYRQAAYDAAVESYNASLLHAVQEVADVLNRWREINTRLAEQHRNIVSAEAKYSREDTLARAGLADRSRSLQARVEENQQRLLLASLEADRRKASVGIIKALGGGYKAEITTAQTP